MGNKNVLLIGPFFAIWVSPVTESRRLNCYLDFAFGIIKYIYEEKTKRKKELSWLDRCGQQQQV